LTRSLGLYAPAEALARRTLGTLGLVALFWALWRGIGVIGGALRGAHWATGNPSAQSILSIGIRLGRVVTLALGAVAVLSSLGYPVAGLLAGLGLGGLAFALAAQKTVENLFGSLSLAIDAPFRVGDFVKIEDFVGTVEAIGLRSTNIRTLDRTLVSIPNGRLAEMRVESYSVRDRLRLACTVGLVYGTSASQMRQVLEGLEAVLRAHPLIWPEAVIVRFKELGASSLDIEIMAWFRTSDWSKFQLIRQEVLLQFLQIVEGAGTGFAFPTRTVHVVREPRPEQPEKRQEQGSNAG
jgi:MscS family membrane protein